MGRRSRTPEPAVEATDGVATARSVREADGVTLNAHLCERNPSSMAGASESAEGAAFARTLSALKEQGSNLLVVGTTYERGHTAVCDRLLGEPDERRRRLLVRVDGQCGSVPHDDGSDTRVVERRRPGFEHPPPSGADDVRVAKGGIDELERVAVEEFAAIEEECDDPEPAELRLCVDSLRPLLVEHGDERVKRFVDQLASRVSRADAMGHFHLPTTSSDKYVTMLTPEVDAVVEVRTKGGQPEQRWHVFDGAVDSGWLPL